MISVEYISLLITDLLKVRSKNSHSRFSSVIELSALVSYIAFKKNQNLLMVLICLLKEVVLLFNFTLIKTTSGINLINKQDLSKIF